MKDFSDIISYLERIDIPETDSLNETLQKFWLMEEFDSDSIRDPALDKFKNSVSFSDGRYSVGLPWKTNHPPLPSNYYYALARLRSNLQTLRKSGDDLLSYHKIIKDQLDAGFIEEVAEKCSDKVHYLAHRHVQKDSETTPLRIVYDCSAKTRGNPSLNDCLYSGPNLINDLTSILLRFRFGKFAALSDIKKAFLNVRLNHEDRDCTRFLWPANPFDTQSTLKTYRFSSVLFGSTASPFLLNATLQFHLDCQNSELATELKENIYIDNLFVTSNVETELIDKKIKTENLLNSAGFSLHEWESNAHSVSQRDMENSFSCNVLGIKWYPQEDALGVSPIRFADDNHAISKRSLVSNVAKIYDPLGIYLPVTIRGRILVQDVWRRKVDWDTHVDSDISSSALSLYRDLSNLHSIRIQRNSTEGNVGDLHIFSDSSLRAYGSVAYLTSTNGTYLLCAKSRLAPINSRTLPELELCAILLSTKLAHFILKAVSGKLKIHECFIWSDSSISLHWLKSSKVKKPFVANRVQKITELSDNFHFSYVKSTDNPADLVTRGLTSRQFSDNLDFWLHGPYWLTYGQTLVTSVQISCDNDCCDLMENSEIDVLNVNVSLETELPFTVKYSSYDKLLKITSYILRFIDKCRKSGNFNSGELKVDELSRAESVLIKLFQRDHFLDEINYLKTEPKTSHIPKLVKDLRLFLDDDILYCGGRIQNSALDESSKFPILLPSRCHLSNLIILGIHEKNHFGLNYTLSALRQRFWVVRARQVIKSLLRKCVRCRKIHGKPFKKPDIPPLPSFRVLETQPFSAVCVDFTGAISVRQNESKNLCKVYVCLFTCAVTRAVHMELVEDLSAEAFIRALIRFSSRRSYPRFLLSDNASNFKHSSSILAYFLKSCSNHQFLLHHSVEWKFLTPRAPWMGGVHERLIGVFKQCLRKVIGTAVLSFVEFFYCSNSN